MAELHTIHGATLPDDGPVEGMVELLEKLLERARSGDMVGFAYAVVGKQGDQTTGWNGAAGLRHPIGTTIDMLHHRYVKGLLEKEK